MSERAPEPTIELSGVTVRFGEVTAVEGVCVAIDEGELLALVGGSGSGKTTTLKTINRLVEPTRGVVRLRGEDVRALVPHVLRRRVGYCFQRIGLFPHMTVAQNVGITPRLLGWDAARVEAHVRERLALVELPPETYADRMPHELSGGQKQRVGVARALAGEPEIVLFDEPFGALDPLTREQLQHATARLRDELGLTGVFVTHDVVEAILLGDRIGVMNEGRLVQVGTARELREAPADDYVARLIDAPNRAAALARGAGP
ncbi:MAG TPA: ATP-binding cassette domain-containing protein [Sandaracinaceae bacterium LLY-WYZ-13_1]|nr:ATP-binding cassette domain-containing protein [Sandaracinaceae bacterium LLY-WYZ-13_1]